MVKISRKRLFRLGVFVVAGLLILFLAVYYLGKQQNIFTSGVTVYAEFSNIKGLQTGNNVRFLGTNAGYVSGLSVKNDSTIVVEILITHNMSRYIRKNSLVEIQNEGIMGSKILEIYPGSGEFNIIEQGSLLPSRTTLSMEELFSSLEETVENSTRASQNLMLVTENILRGEGTLGMLLQENGINVKLEEMSENLLRISRQANEIIAKANSPESDIGKLLNDDVYSRQLEQTMNGFDSLIQNMRLISNEFQNAAEALNDGDGLLSRLLHDSLLANETDTTLRNINNAIENLTETSETIRRSWIFNLFSR
jgi:phospholipid/cholesterol/gamma-HCH transport system substrate-binding protein